MKLKRYAIVHKGEKTRWLKLTGITDDRPDGTSFTLVDKFERACIMDEDQADAFVNNAATDPRYKKQVIDLTIRNP